ncbi:hypothetical protein IE53DRAFT_373275 [Violaceomyces palustris]|uniref:Uncharacterized protein n=1 Tax=Violaceomyces palustris TaxID=1673888 RepID=A0ACD0P4D1_9BASI|nr:hypothetical protein IE53DRAFT_373275 [Violaceomyces palustris]
MADLIRTKSMAFRPPLDKSAPNHGFAAMPRPNRGPAAAADAAAAAEFAEKKYVWIPDKEAGYLSAWVVREEDGGDTSVCSLSDGQMRSIPTFELSKMNPPKFDKAEDIADLTFLNEASVVHNLRQRYFSGLIYTYSGLFLVAVNPYHSLPIYTDAIVAAYKGRRREENAPHVFALADGAMRNMLDNRENQSLLITGESGAGKTENTKKVIQYLAAIAADVGNAVAASGTSSPASAGPGVLTRSGSSRQVLDHLRGIEAVSSKRLGLLERQILQANPILEAFGNAQTIRNNNSSRFGKFVRIEFTSLGAIAGANIDWYLLEKSRVSIRSPKERSFHIFYQLLRSEDAEIKSKLLLTGRPDDYGFLKASRKDIEGVDDRSEWLLLREALNTVGFSPDEQMNLFRVVAAILQIGNIELADDRSEQARITNTPQVEKICHVLGLPEQEFTKSLLRPKVKAGREWVTQSRTRRQVLDEMSALSKTLYEKAFSYLVDRINKALDRPTSKSTFIGVLDIAGFEIFEVNSFEQLCINYTNEKLQQFFNHHMFVLEQEEYARENIEWDFVNFGLDLQPTIDLIESTTPIGILSCLDEECIMPKATDLTFTEKLNRIWATNKDGSAKDEAGAALAAEKGIAHGSTKYAPARFAQGFTIKHYAGHVEYRTDGWLDKNKDPLNDNLTRVMSESTDRFIASLFSEYAENDEAAAAPPGALGPTTSTVAQRHKEQLGSLMTQLSSTQPHFVRCIMDVPLVLEQLRCNGVLEGIRIARLGYPNRLLFSEFRNRYEVLTPGIIPRGYMDGRKACQRMVEALELDRSTFKIGTSKIFFKAGVLADMEERRDSHLFDIFSRFQAAARMFTARRQMKKILNRAAAVRTIQRNARLYLYTRELKRKQLELAMEALEALKFSLENEKKKDKDQLLARSKERESALEDDLAAMQADIDLLDGQLERALAAQKLAEQGHNELKAAFDTAAEHLLRLENEQKIWKERELTLTRDVGKHSQDKEEIIRKLAEKEQDIELEARLEAELEDQSRQSSYQLSELARLSSDHEAATELESITKERDLDAKEISDLKLRIETLSFDLKSAKEDELDETRRLMDAKSSEDEQELQALRSQMADQVSALKAEVESARKEHLDLTRTHQDVSGQVRAQEAKLLEAKRSVSAELEDYTQKAKDDLDRQLHSASVKHQDLEDALLELERGQNSWKLRADHIATELAAETKRRELIESAARQHQSSDKEIAAMKDELAQTRAEMKRVQSMQNKTIVEHVHLADAQSKLQELAHYTKTLEKSKARLVSENEDLTREVGQPSSNGLDKKVNELTNSLREARRERDEAQSNARRKDLQADEMVSRTRQQYEARIAELERQLKGSQMARSTTYANLAELVNNDQASDDASFRRKLLEELRLGHEELEQDITAKGDLLRSHKLNGNSPGKASSKIEKPLYIYGNVAPRGSTDSGSSSYSNGAKSRQFFWLR